MKVIFLNHPKLYCPLSQNFAYCTQFLSLLFVETDYGYNTRLSEPSGEVEAPACSTDSNQH